MQLITTAAEMAELLPVLRRAGRFGFDLEANGRFAYRARTCMVQLAWPGHVVVVDALATDLAPLAEALGEHGPIKIVHDVAFDARMLAEAGVDLGNVHDTAVAAQMLGRAATGLASLAASDLGLMLDKTLQSHDWSRRPLDDGMLTYLATDVAHLEALDDKLWSEADVLGIVPEILEETRYRLASAIRAVRVPDPRPPYSRVKGIEKLSPLEQAVVRRLVDAREREGARLDTPANELVNNAAVLAIAAARPDTVEALKRVRGAMPRRDAYAVARELVRAVAAGVADGGVPTEERAWLDRPRIPPEIIRERRAREGRLLAWRKAEALRRKVNEQVVLPGHCAKELAGGDGGDLDWIARVPGIGAFRVERDGEAILKALLTETPPAG